jgi:hypothetical protein
MATIARMSLSEVFCLFITFHLSMDVSLQDTHDLPSPQQRGKMSLESINLTSNVQRPMSKVKIAVPVKAVEADSTQSSRSYAKLKRKAGCLEKAQSCNEFTRTRNWNQILFYPYPVYPVVNQLLGLSRQTPELILPNCLSFFVSCVRQPSRPLFTVH